MKDHLRELCKKLGLGLVYEDSEPVILSTGVLNSIPTIKAGRIFKECPKEVADAVIGYYTSHEHKQKHLKLLKAFAEDNIVTIDFEIKPPDKKFKSHMNNSWEKNEPKNTITEKPPKNMSVEKPNIESSPSLVEMNISKIVQKDFWGNVKAVDEDSTIKPASDDVLELDIVINKYDG